MAEKKGKARKVPPVQIGLLARTLEDAKDLAPRTSVIGPCEEASTLSPSGPVTSHLTISPPVASTSDCTVPSPPSAIGTLTYWASGQTRLKPASISPATSSDVRFSLKESGAMTIFIGRFFSRRLVSVGLVCSKISGKAALCRAGVRGWPSLSGGRAALPAIG